jgi:hypothetical protein
MIIECKETLVKTITVTLTEQEAHEIREFLAVDCHNKVLLRANVRALGDRLNQYRLRGKEDD